jgi:hypothetical protein
VDGLAHRTLRQEASSNVPPLEDPTDPSADEPALAATGAPFLGLKLLVDHDATGVAREDVTAIAEPARSGQLPLV